MRSILLRCTFVLSLVVSAAAFAAPADLAPGELRYLVTLRTGASPAAVAAVGARVEALNGSSLTVVVPAVAAGRLADLPEVVSVIEVGNDIPTGAVVDDPAVHTTADVRKLAPQDTHTLWGSGQFVYDGAGNILAMGVTGTLNGDGKTSTFTYDAASRLREAVIGRNGEDIHEQYDYDGFGNLTRHQRYSPSAQAITYPPPNYPPSPVTNQLTDPGSQYDAAGNAISVSGSMTMTYDAFNQATSKTQGGHTTTYLYDVNEERIGVQTDTNITHWTIRDFENKPLIQFDSSTALSSAGWATSQWTWAESFIHGTHGMLAAERPAGPLQYHLDHLGSPRVFTDSNGQKQGSVIEYAPYGEEISTPGGEVLKFTGHERDYDPGNPTNDDYLDYMHARYYDARLARFFAIDPRLGIVSHPQSWNRYAYAANDPLTNIDPTGQLNFAAVLSNAYNHAADRIDAAAVQIENSVPMASTLTGGATDKLHEVADILRFGNATGDILDKGGDAYDVTIAVSADVRRGSEGLLFLAELGKDVPVEKVSDDKISAPPEKRGDAPIGTDGHPIEIHHEGQDPNGPFTEKTRTDHRLGDNYKKNHENTGQEPSRVDRKDFRRQTKNYWQRQWDEGRFEPK